MLTIKHGFPLGSTAYGSSIGHAAVNTTIHPSQILSYTHTLSANNYYETANFQFAASFLDLDFWLSQGVGRDVVVYDRLGGVAWEGQVNSVTVTMGLLSITRGPITDMANSVYVKYTDFTTNEQAVTSLGANSTSVALYGTYQKVLSTGKISSTNATAILNTYLGENSYPQVSQQAIGSQANETSITLECVGYHNVLDRYVYYSALTSTSDLDDKVQDVLAAEPDGIISTNYANIEPNTLNVSDTETEYRTARDIIKELVAMGGSGNNNRRIYGVGQDRIFYISEVPSIIEYTIDIRQPLNIFTPSGERLLPETIKPGKWIGIIGLGNDPFTTDLSYSNYSVLFAEQVIFTAPTDLQINGARVGTLSQRLAKLGLGGI